MKGFNSSHIFVDSWEYQKLTTYLRDMGTKKVPTKSIKEVLKEVEDSKLFYLIFRENIHGRKNR